MVWTRRKLLRHLRGLLVGGVACYAFGFKRGPGAEQQGQAASLDAGPDPPEPVIDTHQHLWDLSRLRLPWLAGAGKLNRSYLMSDYLEAAAGLGIVKAVYMEVAVAEEMLVQEAEWVIEICQQGDSPTVAAVIGGRPAAPDFREYVFRFKDSPFVKGIRHILPGDQATLWESPEFIRGIRLLGQIGWSFDLCLPARLLEQAIRLVDRCPETRFVLDHCGNGDPVAFMTETRRQTAGVTRPPDHDPEQWKKDVARLAERKNVICKISGIVARAPEKTWVSEDLAPLVNHCVEVFGAERVIFASDWPVCTRVATLAEWLNALRQIVADRPAALRRALFSENAIKFYGLA